MKFTADSLTLEQIQAVHVEAYRAGDHMLCDLCSDAKRAGVGKIAKERKLARARIAEILNARSSK